MRPELCPSRVVRRRACLLTAASAFIALSPAPVRAADKYWVGADGFWHDPAWSTTPGGPVNATPPGMGDNAHIISSATLTVTRNAAAGILNGIGTVDLDGTGGALVTLDKVDGTNFNFANLNIGITGQGRFVAGTGNISVGFVSLGQNNGSSGTAVFNGTGLALSSGMTIGNSGIGEFTQTGGGTSFQLGITLASDVGSIGTYTLNSGTLAANTNNSIFTVASLGTGYFNMNGGTATLGQLISAASTSTGYVTINAGVLNVGSFTQIGESSGAGVGYTYLNGGTVTFQGPVTVNPRSEFRNQGATLLLGMAAGWTVNGGTAELGDKLYSLTSANPIVVKDGYFAARNIVSNGIASINFQSGTVALTGADFHVPTNHIFGSGSISLPANKALVVSGTTTISSAFPVVIDGGTFSTGFLAGPKTALQFNSGTFRLTSDSLTIGTNGLFGDTYTLDSNHRIQVNNTVFVNSEGLLYINGGALDTGGLYNFGGEVRFGSPTSRVNGFVQNDGFLSGTGRINGALFNSVPGEVRAGATDTLRILSSGTNDGLINMVGGVVDYTGPLTNTATGRITGRGMLHASSIGNAGSILVTAGVMDVHGALGNSTGGKTIVSGDAIATFFDAVTNDPGSEFRVSTNSTAVFFGTVTGLAQFTGSGVKIFEGATLPGPLATLGSTIVGPAGNVVAQHVRESALSVEGMLSVVPNGTSTGVSRVGALDIPGGRVDLNNNALVVDYTSSSPIATIKALILSGRAGGDWSGDGLTSSLANANNFALGYAEASAINASSFLGQSVDGSTLLIRYTRYGDANLDGVVNALDFNALAARFAQSGTFWSDGDFNYNGTVNTQDFTMLGANFGQTLPSPPLPSSALGSLVPEPAAIAAITGLALLPRRKRFSH